MLWAWPALGSGQPGLIRLHATQFLLLTGAMVVVVVERQIEEGDKSARVTATERDPSPTVTVAPAAATFQKVR
jgi:hypothetical protein